MAYKYSKGTFALDKIKSKDDATIIDDKKLIFGSGDDASFEYDENGADVVQYAGADMRIGHGAATKLQFRDSALYINSSTDGQLDLAADAKVLLTAGTVEASADLKVGDDLSLTSDSAVMNFGAGNDVTFTHDGGTGMDVAAAGAFDITAGAASTWKTSAGDLTVKSAADIVMQAQNGDVLFADGTTNYLKLAADSNDAVFQIQQDAKNFLFNQYDGNTVMKIKDNETVDMSGHNGSSKGLALGGTLVTATAAELNYSDITELGSSEASKVLTADASGDVKIKGAAAHMVWDKSEDALEFGDNASIEMGAGLDMKLYHDGTNSYISNAVGALKIATETSGIAVTIGHSTSEVTIADNLTVSGDLTVTGNTITNQVEVISTSTGVLFEGGVDDGHEATLKSAVAGADVTYTLPNLTGHVPLLADAASNANVTAAEFALLDGGSSVNNSITVADGDGVLFNDGGTMKQVDVRALAAYFDDEITAMPNLVQAGALNAGSITSGFGNIDNGSSTLDTGVATVASMVCTAGATFGGGLGSSGVTISTAGAISADARIVTDDTTEATSTTDGSIQTDGGLSVAKSVVVGDDLDLLSDAAILNFGADKDVNLTHVADTGLLLNSSMAMQFGDADTNIKQSADGVLKLSADSKVLTSGKFEAGGDIVGGGKLTLGSADITEAELEMIDGITAGAAAASKAMVLDSNKDFDGMRNLTLDGSIVGGANLSLDSGTTNISSAELNVLDSVTPGTAAASKALVLDASKNIATIGTVGCGAITSTGNSTFGRVQIDGASDYIDVDTNLQVVAAADIVLDPAGGEVKVDGNLVPNSDSDDELGASGTAWKKLFVDHIDLNGQGDITFGGTGRLDLDADDDTSIRASADDIITFEAAGADQVHIEDGAFFPQADSDVALGKTAKRFSALYVDSLVAAYSGSVSANYAAVAGDFFIGVDTSSGAITVTLPTATAALAGKMYVIKDVGGSAGSNAISITGSHDTNSIDGSKDALSIDSNYGAVNLMSDGSAGWFVW